MHVAPNGNELIAENIYNIVTTIYEFETNNYIDYVNDLRLYGNREFFKLIFSKGTIRQYITKLEDIAKNTPLHAGTIIMNANPFTKGHQYLVEFAASQVEHLFVFVLEEDKSFFKFKDRIELVEKGTEHLKNVTVLASGEGIISSITMPGYFTKEIDSEQKLDASADIAIFANLIAPACKITKRFVGNEPFCKVTAQYNEQMREKLGEFGIGLVIVDRCKTDYTNNVISATKVRSFLEQRDFDSLKQYVPETTLEFLYKLEYR